MRKIKNTGQHVRRLLAVLLAAALLAGFSTEARAAQAVSRREGVSQIQVHPGNAPDEDEKADEEQKAPKPIKPVKWKKVLLNEPQSFQARAVKNGIRLSWKKNKSIRKYEVYRKQEGSSKYKLAGTTKQNNFTDTKVKYGVVYTYKVRAVKIMDKKTYKSGYSETESCCSYRIDPSKPMVALTYDDGPSIYTPQILDVLEQYHARATFFEVGNRVGMYPKTVKRIDGMGCELGNHSYDHANLGIADAGKVQTELSQTDSKIKSLTGKVPALVRPPYGSIGGNLRSNAKRPLILWSIDTLDWKTRNAASVYASVMNYVKDGDIILMHDLYLSTVNASKQIIPELIRRGYQLVTVSELAEYKGISLHAGESYSRLRK